MMYRKILALTEEIETVIATDDHVRLEDLRLRRAEAFAAMEAQDPQGSPEEAIAIIKKIQECERQCQEQAIRKIEALKKDMEGIRNGKRLEKAYCQFASNS